MKKKKNRRILIYSVLILLLALLLVVRNFSRQSVPDYTTDRQVSGLTDQVSVYRDSFGIPHLFAQNEKDLYLAVGYVMAQDRLWQMDLLRRVTTGRLAEILSDELIEVDVLMRSLEMSKKSQKIYQNADPDLKASVDAFAAGVNAFLSDQGNKLPFEFKLLGYTPEPWEPIHSINLIGYMAWDLSTGWPNELTLHKIKEKVDQERYADFIPDIPNQSTSVFKDFHLDSDTEALLTAFQKVNDQLDALGLDVFRGSNNWVVSGDKTQSGEPLLANDMHLGLSVPGIWYQMHQVVEGKLDVTGVVLPGQPLVVAGHNQDIAWGFTNVMTDGLDFYEETLHPDNPDKYLVDGEWKDLRIKKEEIINAAGDTLIFTNKFTHRGPVVTDIKAIAGKTISMSWIGLLESNELRTVYLLNRAQNWDDFRNALRHFVSVNQNVAYADTEGNIGLHSTIGIPLRTSGGIEVYPGDTSLYDWKGLVPFEELPYSFNPESGFLSSANNRTTDPDYPHYISAWYDLPYRQDRIQELLKAGDQMTSEDFIRIQADQQSKMAEKFAPFFIAGISGGAALTEAEEKALNQLKSWDYELNRESVGATIFEYLYYHFARQLAIDELGEELFGDFVNKKNMLKNFMENMIAQPQSAWYDRIDTEDQQEDLPIIAMAAFREAIKQITLDMGLDQEDWHWGNVHKLTLTHPLSSVRIIDRILNLSRGPYAVGGSHHTVCPFAYDYMDASSIAHGASHRHIYDLGDWDKSLTVIPTGTSGVPASIHYCDQTELYLNNQYHSDYVSKDRIVASARYRMTLQPKE